MKRFLLTTLALGGLLLWAPATFAQTQICIPQFVDGIVGPLRWQTTLIVHNQDQVRAQMQMNFYDSSGRPMSGMTMRNNAGRGPHNQVGPNGQFAPNPVGPRAGIGFRSNGQGPLQAGFVQIQSQNRIQAHAMLHLLDAIGNNLSEVGISPHPPFRVGNFFLNHSDGAGGGVSLSNPSGTQPATCNLEVFGEDETTPLGSAQVTLGPRGQLGRFIRELFPGILSDGVGFVRISCDQPVCGLALHLRGLAMTQIPIFIEP